MTRRRGNHDEKVDMLHDLDNFGQCTHDELDRLGVISTESRLAAGSVVCRLGEFQAESFVIVDGAVAWELLRGAHAA